MHYAVEDGEYTAEEAAAVREDLAELFDSTSYCKDKVLWTVQLSLVSEYQTITLESDIIWASIEGHTGVSGIELDPTEIIFSGAVNE